MSLSPEWEQRYRERSHWSLWPWSDLVSLVYRHCSHRLANERLRVFEFGCGPGANIPFFKAIGADYYSVEGSASAVAAVHAAHPDLTNEVTVGDFSQLHSLIGEFDLVVDRASITHNDTASVERCLSIALETLKPGGGFIGSDWFSTAHSDYLLGEPRDDWTRANIASGQFKGVGQVHFSDEAHLRTLFSQFELLLLEEKTLRRCEPGNIGNFASWNIVARKPLI